MSEENEPHRGTLSCNYRTTRDKEKILQAARVKTKVIYKGPGIRTSALSTETRETRRQ